VKDGDVTAGVGTALEGKKGMEVGGEGGRAVKRRRRRRGSCNSLGLLILILPARRSLDTV